MTTIRVRVLATAYTVTVLEWEKSNPLRTRKRESAIHALDTIRTLVVGSGRTYALEQTAATRAAFDTLCERAYTEIDAAIHDIK